MAKKKPHQIDDGEILETENIKEKSKRGGWLGDTKRNSRKNRQNMRKEERRDVCNNISQGKKCMKLKTLVQM